MLQVHHEGRAIVSSGPRERMEHDTSRLHAYGLWASYQRGLVKALPPPRGRRRGAARPGRGGHRRAAARPARAAAGRREADVGGDPVLAPAAPRRPPRATPRLAADYRELTESSLRSGKADDLARRARRRCPPGAGSAAGPPTRPAAWLRTTNDLRLALGTRLDITEDTEPPDDVTGEEGQQLAVYYWLTALQGSLVDALAAGRAGRR